MMLIKSTLLIFHVGQAYIDTSSVLKTISLPFTLFGFKKLYAEHLCYLVTVVLPTSFSLQVSFHGPQCHAGFRDILNDSVCTACSNWIGGGGNW